ncbi:hypothetical protein SG34_000465 [Thalassomonas viridans]|uniref:Uncharacterized protein n=1 Tax=Thalassomonas viridans TaxID=137584 RepID=A0AAF0CA34_9GAMM|nr:hypothetical protein [Thalassomonas viridans]WDE05459.1 hypothetical protein SG34_000465 [Thalassomonas viridans]
MKIANQPASAPATSSMLDRGLNQLEQVTDRAVGGLTDLGQGFNTLLSRLTDDPVAAASPKTGATAKNNATPLISSDPAMANNAEHAKKIAAGVAVRTAAAAARQEADNGNPPPAEQQVTEKTQTPDMNAGIQQQILSTLGLNFTDSQGLDTDNITSAGSLDALQGALLSSLQASLFSGKTRQAETNGKTGAAAAAEQIAGTGGETSMLDSIAEFSFGDNGLELTDAFDSVNILQHIPVVSGIYQQVTEQDMSAVAKLTGGFLYGGPVGLAVSAADLTLEGITGNSINSTVIDFDYQGLFDGITDSVLGSETDQTAAGSNSEVAATALSTSGLSSPDLSTTGLSASVLAQLPQFKAAAEQALSSD